MAPLILREFRMSGGVLSLKLIDGRRVILRPATDLDEVTSLLESLPGCESGDLRERLVVERRSDGAAVGVVEFGRREPEDGWLTFGAIVMAEGERGWGYGSEAVHLIEAESGARRFRAAVAKSLGLAFYFWLRQGYHPASPEEEPVSPAGGDGDIIWVVRSNRDQVASSQRERLA